MFRCYPVSPVQNGDFSKGSDSWNLSANLLSATASVPVLGTAPSKYLQLNMLGSGTASISQTVHMCAGAQYKLDFQLYVNSKTATVTVSLGGRTVSSTPFTNQYYWVAQGPYTLPVFNAGDAGTTQGDNHFLDVDLTISVAYPSGLINVAEIAALSMYAV